MANKKITDLTALTLAASDDYLEIVDTSATASKKISRENLVGWHFLTTPLTSTSWDGDSKGTGERATVDLSAVFGVPAGVKAVLISVQTQADTANDWIGFGSTGMSGFAVVCYTQVSGQNMITSGIVPCDANGDIYCYPSGTIENVTLRIWGYFL
jgi:hypothetical protein